MPVPTVNAADAIVAQPQPNAQTREPALITTAPHGHEGEGFPVRRAFAGVPHEALDPFVHMDQMGAVNYEPGEPKGTSWHPHRGFETVTYMIDGQMEHQDSNGGGGLIANGDTQWMTAGAGILHKEAPPEHLVTSGGMFHGLQLWVNLPSRHKMIAPRYQDLRADDNIVLTNPDTTAIIRLIAGQLGEHVGPGTTHTPTIVSHITLTPDAQLLLPWPEHFNALVYVLSGKGTVGTDRSPIEGGQLAVLGPGSQLQLNANGTQNTDSPNFELYVLGGKPIREPIAQYGPFVMNSKAELIQAVEDFNAGRLGKVPVTH